MEKEFTLPGGYLDSEGDIHKTVVVTPVTGKVKRLIGQPGVRKSGHAILNTILSHCVKSVGSVDKVTKKVLDGMLTGDRQYCAMMIRKFRGDVIRCEEQCRRCEAVHIYEVNIDDYEVKHLQDEDWRLETLRGSPRRVFDLVDEEINLDSSFAYVRGYDEKAVEGIMRKNPFEGQFALLDRCLVRWCLDGNEKDPPYHRSMWDSLYDHVVSAVEAGFSSAQPGPAIAHYEECPECGSEVSVTFENSDFLFQSRADTRKGYSLR